jgi:hypothetical protein
MRYLAIAVAVLSLVLGVVPLDAPSAGAQTAANPDLVASCGVNITLIIDRSNSISTAEANDIRDAARALIRGLVGTGSKVQVITFATRAAGVVRSTSGAYSSGDLADLRYYDAADLVDLPAFYSPGNADGGTNWDDALEFARRAANISPLTVFLTDGDPTYRLSTAPDGHGGAIAGTGSATSPADLTQAQQEAGYLRTGTHPAGARPATHLFGVGVGLGDASSRSRLSSVTGTDELTLGAGGNVLVNGVPGEFAKADYTIVPDFDALEFAFVRFVWALCSQTFTMTTRLQRADGTTAPAAAFPALTVDLVVGPAAPQAWDLPPQPAGPSARLTSAGDGRAQFRWRPTPPSSVSTAAVTVSGLPAGYVFNGVRCTTVPPGTSDPPTTVLDTVGPNQGGANRGAASWSFPAGINIHLDGSCELFLRELRGAAPATEQLVITATALSPSGGRPVQATAVVELDDPAATDARITSWRTG